MVESLRVDSDPSLALMVTCEKDWLSSLALMVTYEMGLLSSLLLVGTCKLGLVTSESSLVTLELGLVTFLTLVQANRVGWCPCPLGLLTCECAR